MSIIQTIRQQITSLFGKGAACAQFCEQLHPKGADRTQCVRDGADHTPGNLCDACDGDFSRICAGPSGRHVCCQTMQVCDTSRGVCV